MKEKAEVGGPYSKRYQSLRRMEPFYVVIADIVILPRHTLAYAAVVNMQNNLSDIFVLLQLKNTSLIRFADLDNLPYSAEVLSMRLYL